MFKIHSCTVHYQTNHKIILLGYSRLYTFSGVPVAFVLTIEKGIVFGLSVCYDH